MTINWDNVHNKAGDAGEKVSKVVVKANKVGGGILGFLKTANAALEQIPGGILAYFDTLAEMGENVSQAFVDSLCRYAAWMVNISIERIRQKVLKSVYEQNLMVRIIVDVIDIGKKVIQDPLGVIPSFFDRLTAPFKAAKQLITDIITEISKLSQNVTKIMQSLPPKPPNPDINFDEFKIEIKAFDIGALAPADSFPAPEVIFPKPPGPFGAETFKEIFAEGKKTLQEGAASANENTKKVFYKPKSISS